MLNPNSVRLLDGRARDTGAPPPVGEPELLDRDHAGQRHDGEAGAAHTQRRDADDQAHDDTGSRPDQRTPRKADTGAHDHVRHDEPRHPGEGDLRQ